MLPGAPEPQSPEQEANDRADRERPAFERERSIPVRVEQEPAVEPEAQRLKEKIRRGETSETRPRFPAAPQTPAAPSPRPLDPVTKEIEDILSEDLGTMYSQLSPEQQAVFKREGERAAAVIRNLIVGVTVKVKSVLDIIRRWLKLIPGVNKFFLEQEAKIKADKIAALHARVHHREP